MNDTLTFLCSSNNKFSGISLFCIGEQKKLMVFSMHAGEAISGGKLVIEVSFFGVHIHTETHDLCAETSCPISVGDFMLSHSQALPGYTPPVSYPSYSISNFTFNLFTPLCMMTLLIHLNQLLYSTRLSNICTKHLRHEVINLSCLI